jgi:hypothetical protein
MISRFKKPNKLQKRRSSDSMKLSVRSSENEDTASQRSMATTSEADIAELASTAGGMEHFLELDPRPTFVVRVDAALEDSLEPAFANLSFRSNHQLVKALEGSKSSSPPHSPKVSSLDFRLWLQEVCQLDSDDLDLPPFSFCGHIWTAFRIRHQTVISGTSNSPSYRNTKSFSRNLPLRPENRTVALGGPPSDAQILRSKSAPIVNNQMEITPVFSPFTNSSTPDWTTANPVGDLSPHIIFARSIDWGLTPLGEMYSWTKEFRTVANLLMRNPHPAALFWGDELTVMVRTTSGNKFYIPFDPLLRHHIENMFCRSFTSHPFSFPIC